MSGERGMVCPKCKGGNYYTEQKGAHMGAYCSACGTWIKWIPQYAELKNMVVYKGKHKGKKLSEIPPDYLAWASSTWTDGAGRKIKEYLDGKKQPLA